MINLPRLTATFRATLVLAVLSLGMTPAVSAQQMESTVVAVVDVQRLLRESLAGKAMEGQMNDLRAGFGAQVNERETALRLEEQELQNQASLLSSDVLQERRRQFEEKVVVLQRDVRERQQALEQTYAEGISQIRQVIIEILQAMVEERGIDLVVTRNTILVASRRLDVTEDVLVELDRRLPSVTLSTAN